MQIFIAFMRSWLWPFTGIATYSPVLITDIHLHNTYTLLGIITVGLLTTGEIFDREKYGGILQNPPHYPGHSFTSLSGQPFNFKIQKITKM